MAQDLDFSDFVPPDVADFSLGQISTYDGVSCFKPVNRDDLLGETSPRPQASANRDPTAKGSEGQEREPCRNQEIELVNFYSEEPASPRTIGSWDLPTGPIAWDDTDLIFEQLLHYADLTLTEEEENGVLTDRIIASCASYLTRSPASKCHVVAKVCLDNKNLSDIRIIAYHRFLQYVDLSWNNIKDLSPLGNLPYLMYLDVSHNLLEEVLQFKPPWNLTYVNYSYNEVWQINDLSDFWSLSYLDLSHNKISKIQGLDTLRYLRHLNLSYNKITRFENLNHSRITDLNLEYNLISTFENGEDVGVKTMLDLSSLCLNNNLIADLGFLKGVYHLKKLELQCNRITNLLELSNMRSLRKLTLLDLTGNPVCEYKPYRHLLLKILPELKFLDQTEVHMSEKVATHLGRTHLLQTEAARNNARMILLDQMNDDPLDLDILPIDQASYPLVILVGPSASGKKLLVSKLGEKYSDKIFIGKLHTTREVMEWEKSVLIKIRREEFNEKIKKGHFYCVMENLGHFYGFGKEMLGLAVKSHKLCLTYMDLEGALTIHSYGIQPYLVLTMLNSEKEHGDRLKKFYGPVITLLGAAYVAKRELSDTHARNLRRVQEIIHDVIEMVVFWVEERHNMRFSQLSAIGRDRSDPKVTRFCTGAEVLTYRQNESASAENLAYRSRQTSYISTKEGPATRKFECMSTCSPGTCGLQEFYKGMEDANQDATDHSVTSAQNTNSDEAIKDEGSGTCSTSYSAVVPPPLRAEPGSLDDEGSFGEDDIFADWSSPFIDWDEVNVDPVALEEAAEELCQNFVSSVLNSRRVYQSIHLDNPGLFSHVLFSDDEDEALKNLTEFLKDVWRSVPTKHPLFNIEQDYAYQEMVPKRLEKLKEIIKEESSSAVEDHCFAESFAQINSPRSIVTQMQLMGYEDTAEMV